MAVSAQGLRVALKHPFYSPSRSSSIRCFNFADESRKVLTEGTLLGWADSLICFSYEFTNDFISAHPQKASAPSIPCLQFVQGVIAYPDPVLHRAAYLLEELIPDDFSFIKYIHNADAVLLQEEDEPGYELGVLLCFVQHVQFTITHGQVYLSDFQGAENLLTDPQVMMHPNLFGEGNVKKAFSEFASQHKCNKYCKLFELEGFFFNG
ncbi:hypothetical protein BDN70DRAFT_800181 [Pholiota conissans]|uniref:Alpha-type protein kinase domain-containing protein n=1 Tax=Pholiota conissans TaxID=109636 RepID=A0A9P6D486_9AGAR|nr:hypothetical protein BDN70DRAFT_800181 [Pholiota conissans]